MHQRFGTNSINNKTNKIIEDLKREINNIEDKAIALLYYALYKYQERTGKEYFVISPDNIGVKYFDSLNGLVAIPVGSICADYDGNVKYCGKEDWTLPDFNHIMYDYEDLESYKTLKKGEMLLSDIVALQEMVNNN